MDDMLILGDGGLGRAVETAARERVAVPGRGGRGVRVLGRPAAGRHDPASTWPAPA